MSYHKRQPRPASANTHSRMWTREPPRLPPMVDLRPPSGSRRRNISSARPDRHLLVIRHLHGDPNPSNTGSRGRFCRLVSHNVGVSNLDGDPLQHFVDLLHAVGMKQLTARHVSELAHPFPGR